MDKKDSWKVIEGALKDVAEEAYVADYIQETDPTQLLAESLGLAVAHHFGWGGEEAALFLLTALSAALEDCNWHAENGVILDWVEKMRAGTILRDILYFPPETE